MVFLTSLYIKMCDQNPTEIMKSKLISMILSSLIKLSRSSSVLPIRPINSLNSKLMRLNIKTAKCLSTGSHHERSNEDSVSGGWSTGALLYMICGMICYHWHPEYNKLNSMEYIIECLVYCLYLQLNDTDLSIINNIISIFQLLYLLEVFPMHM